MDVRDMFGKEILPGDSFAYAVSEGRSASMRIYKCVGYTTAGGYTKENIVLSKLVKPIYPYGNPDPKPSRLHARKFKNNAVKLNV